MNPTVVLILFVTALTRACVYKNERFNDGDTWVVRSTFVMRCSITKTGWSTTVIGCKTAHGLVVKPGEMIKEGETTYQCKSSANGRVEIRRTYDVQNSTGCEGHEIGETWVIQRNFMKECTSQGVRIKECLTDAGIVVPLNTNLNLSGILYTCTQHNNGTVSINREAIPNKNHFQVDNQQLRPVELLGSMYKRFKMLGKLLQVPAAGPVEQDFHTTHEPIPVEFKRSGNELDDVTCSSGGKVYKAEETWISENKFTKKCTPEGAVIILNCLIDGQTTINVNSELKIGKKMYKCYRSIKEGRVFLEITSE